MKTCTKERVLLLESRIQLATDGQYYLVCTVEEGEPYHLGDPCKTVEEVLRLQKLFHTEQIKS
jgi:hypothetical protein